MLPIIPTPGKVKTGSYPWLPSEFEPNLDDMRPYLQEQFFFPIDSMLRDGQDMTLWGHRKRARGWEVCLGGLRLRRFWVHGEFSSRWIPNHCRSVLSPVAVPRAAGCVLALSCASCLTSTESGITRADFWRSPRWRSLLHSSGDLSSVPGTHVKVKARIWLHESSPLTYTQHSVPCILMCAHICEHV